MAPKSTAGAGEQRHAGALVRCAARKERAHGASRVRAGDRGMRTRGHRWRGVLDLARRGARA
eukprot:742772-Alexandrium_andersonii.AAC.2